MSDFLICLVTSSKISEWTSCQFITQELDRCYISICQERNTSFHRIRCDNKKLLSQEDLDFVTLQSRQKIIKMVFIDHTVYPHNIFNFFSSTKINWENIEIFIHILGDTTIRVKEWIESIQDYQGKKTSIISASHSANMQNKLFFGKNSQSIIPYPVRKSFKVKDHHEKETENYTRLIYSGRLTAQKNILSLLKLIHLYNSLSYPHKIHLSLCGDFDEQGSRLFGLQKSKKWLKEVKEELSRDHISYHGSLGEKGLKQLYRKHDYFISLSTFHDEDFGLAPAEALACGLPCILTRWGGFNSFPEKHTFFVDIVLSDTGYRPDLKKALKVLVGLRKHPIDIRTGFTFRIRERIIQEVFEASALEFKGVNQLFKRYADIFLKMNGSPYYQGTNLDLYQEIYKPYSNLTPK